MTTLVMWAYLALVSVLVIAGLFLWAIYLAGDREGDIVDEEPTMNTRGKD